MLSHKRALGQHRGATLIELLVGFLVALVVLSATAALFLLSNRASIDLLRANRLNHTLQTSSHLMMAELRRAGYWNSQVLAAPSSNPFETITVGTNCVLFAYDRLDAAGSSAPDGLIQNAERSGFRLVNNEVQVRTSGNTLTNCNDANDTWENLTDQGTASVSVLTFTLNARCLNPASAPASVVNAPCDGAFSSAPSGTQLVELREIVIAMAASSDSNADSVADATKSLTTQVTVRNNRVFIKP
jgi:Tfp pilus assembly protein PilW